jgi:Family of unknown function (DUF6502)
MSVPRRAGSKSASRAARPRRVRASTVGATSLEAVGRFVRILARCGATPQDIVRAVRTACQEIPADWAARARSAVHYIDDAAHVLTIWFSEPAYLDAAGRPRALPLKGTSHSVAALVRSVDRRLDVRGVVAYLLRRGAIRRQGKRYVPRVRVLLYRGAQGPDYFRTLRVLTHMLGTLEHNVLPKRLVRGWFEYSAENPRFPARARAELDERVNRFGKDLLSRFDAYMRRREVTRDPGEPTVRVGIGMHLWEDPRQPFRVRSAAGAARRARSSRQKGPRRSR